MKQKVRVSDRLLDERYRQAEIDALRERVIEGWDRGEIDRAAESVILSDGGPNQITFERKYLECKCTGEWVASHVWKARSYYAAMTNYELTDNFNFTCPHGQKVTWR